MVQGALATKPRLLIKPLYLQVRDHFLELIASGEWEADRPIKSELDLASGLEVSVGT